MEPYRLARGFGAAAIFLALAGCAPSGPTGDVTEPTPTSSSVAGPSPTDTLLCAGISVSREAEENRIPVTEMGEHEGTALSEAVWDDGSPVEVPPDAGWYLAATEPDRVGVMRDIAVTTDPNLVGTPPDHEILTVSWIDNATNVPPGWYVAQSSQCALTIDLGDLTVPAMEFQSQPGPDSTELHLLVTERSCNSGKDAAGRIEIVSLDEADDRVSIVLGVQEQLDAQTCPANPATHYTVRLTEPLGTRDVVDGSLANPRHKSGRG
jgi:hypothetical protein